MITLFKSQRVMKPNGETPATVVVKECVIQAVEPYDDQLTQAVVL